MNPERMEQRSQRPCGIGGLRRAIAFLVLLSWIAGSILCPVPALADKGPAQMDRGAAPVAHEHGGNHAKDQSDLCCDVLGQVQVAAASIDNFLYQPPAPDQTHFLADGDFHLVAADASDEAINLQHGPDPPPRRSWPQFSKIWSQAPPADRR